VVEADVDYRKSTDGAYTRQKSHQKNQTEAILRVSGEMEESPNRRYQMGDRSSYPKAWAYHAGAHGQEPMKVLKPRSMMQEHRQLSKRASTSSGDQLDKQTKNFESALVL
jgi:hypothetical protein